MRSSQFDSPFLCRLRRLALETDEALKEQDKKLGEILGKLQVNQLYIYELYISIIQITSSIILNRLAWLDEMK